MIGAFAAFATRRPDRRAGWKATMEHGTAIRIERWDPGRDGPLTEAALRAHLEALGFDVAVRLYSPGPIVAVHTDARLRIQAVLSGEVRVTIDGDSAVLTAGDAVFIPGGAIRCIEALGSPAAHCLEGAFRPSRV